VILQTSAQTNTFIQKLVQQFNSAPVGSLLSKSVEEGMGSAVQNLQSAGAELLVGGQPGGGVGFCYQNTLLQVSGDQFLSNAEHLQEEAFGNESLLVLADSIEQICQILRRLEGNLTGTIYSAEGGDDDAAYNQLVPILRRKVGRLLNDKMPTGVAVSAAMNHGGPYPATAHPGFTAVGVPAAITRFAQLQCFDNIRADRLPVELQDANPLGIWRFVDGQWTNQN